MPAVDRVINNDPQFPSLVDLPLVDGGAGGGPGCRKRLAVDRLSRHIGAREADVAIVLAQREMDR